MIEKRDFYINGAWVKPLAARDWQVIDPSTEEPCAVISLGSEADTNAAVAAAKAAFPKWAETPNPDAKIEKGYMGRLRSVGQIPPQVGPRIAIPRGNDPTAIKTIVDAKFFLSATPALPDTGPYRPKFAAWLTSKENPYFARASVNRLWAHFFARGLVNPIDDMTPQNSPSHPELLDLLEREFKASGFDIKQLVRVICNSETYQRSSRPTKDNRDDQEWYSHMPMRVLNAHQLLDSYSLALSRTVPINFGNRDAWTANFMPQDADEPATNLTQGIPQFLQTMNGNLGSGFTLPKAIGGNTARLSTIEMDLP